MVLALEGDSTMTRFVFAIGFYIPFDCFSIIFLRKARRAE